MADPHRGPCGGSSAGPRYGPRVRAGATERFVELVQRSEDEIPLDEAALLVAAHDHDVDVDAALATLDDLAGAPGLGGGTAPVGLADLARHLFVDEGFAGDGAEYHDPRNSYLDEVLRRRLGMPITLSVVMIEVGRRCGVECVGVGMPGHFLVGGDAGFVDPFHGGVLLDAAGARQRFERLHPGAPFLPSYLDPVGPRAILARVLANLVTSFATRAPLSATWALQLRLAIPGLAPAERRHDEARLARLRARLN